MKPDPKPSRLCACGCKRVPARHMKRFHATKAQYDVDPFASRKCCERFHGIKTRSGETAPMPG